MMLLSRAEFSTGVHSFSTAFLQAKSHGMLWCKRGLIMAIMLTRGYVIWLSWCDFYQTWFCLSCRVRF
jgi:hypothetical protein